MLDIQTKEIAFGIPQKGKSSLVEISFSMKNPVFKIFTQKLNKMKLNLKNKKKFSLKNAIMKIIRK